MGGLHFLNAGNVIAPHHDGHIGQPVSFDFAAIVTEQRHREHAAFARLFQRHDDVAEPPLVDMPIASPRAELGRSAGAGRSLPVPISFATAVMLAGSIDNDTAGTGRYPGRQNAIDGPVIRVGRRSPIAKENQLSAAVHALMDRSRCARDYLAPVRLATCARSWLSSRTFITIEAATCSGMPPVSCFSCPRKG